MLRNYVITTLRHLLKNRSTTFINIVGLALGIGCLLIILTVIRYELGFDRFHTDADRIYRVVRVSNVDGETEYRTGVSFPVPDALKADLTSVQQVAAMLYENSVQVSVYGEDTTGNTRQHFQEDQGFVFLEPDFFRIFDYRGTDLHWISGSAETSLNDPYTVVLTRSLAEKYFPREEALGRTLRLQNRIDVKVSGVISDFPDHSDFPFRLIASYATLKALIGEGISDWGSVSDINQCYVLLNEGVTSEEVEAQIDRIHTTRAGEELASFRSYLLQPLREVHSDARYGNFRWRTVSPETIWALAIIGLFIIVTAGINFVNLSTAQAVIRSKEVGVRKVMGSRRKQLVLQFLGETLITTSLAGVLALGSAELVVLSAGDLLQIGSHRALLTDPWTFAMLLATVLLATLLAGSYPATVMSGYNPVAALKNKISRISRSSLRLRGGLVTLQFIIAQVFIIGTIVVIQQMEYFRNADLGFDQEAVITLRLPENDPQSLQTLKNQWASLPAVEATSFAYSEPSGRYRNNSHQDIRRPDAPESEEGVIFEHQTIDEEYLELYQIPLLAGRSLVLSDTLQSIIINRTLAERLGFAQPEDAIGEPLLINGQELTVVGVTEDFHSNSLKERVDYVAFTINPRRYRTANIKLSIVPGTAAASNRLTSTLEQIEASWTSTYPEYVFDYSFLDESIAAYYQEETRLSQLFKILAGISIFIGCLGLYGLVAFMAVRRTKEVGIRKVLGASARQILVLFSRDFIYLILIAFCIAGPVAYYLMQQWLNNFTYQITLGANVFLIAIVSSLLIALLTVGYQSLKAALANPADSLRNE